MNLNEAKKILKNNGYLVESKVATKEDFDNLFKLCGFEKTKGEFNLSLMGALLLYIVYNFYHIPILLSTISHVKI